MDPVTRKDRRQKENTFPIYVRRYCWSCGEPSGNQRYCQSCADEIRQLELMWNNDEAPTPEARVDPARITKMPQRRKSECLGLWATLWRWLCPFNLSLLCCMIFYLGCIAGAAILNRIECGGE